MSKEIGAEIEWKKPFYNREGEVFVYNSLLGDGYHRVGKVLIMEPNKDYIFCPEGKDCNDDSLVRSNKKSFWTIRGARKTAEKDLPRLLQESGVLTKLNAKLVAA